MPLLPKLSFSCASEAFSFRINIYAPLHITLTMHHSQILTHPIKDVR